jgi:heterodisulfide reductase subunit A
VEFVRGKVAAIREDAEQNPVVKVELTEEGRTVERTHDLVVLSLGMVPAPGSNGTLGLPVGTDNFILTPAPNAHPCATAHPGIFVTGTAMGPIDIVDSIVTASSAAATVSAYIRERQKEAVYA